MKRPFEISGGLLRGWARGNAKGLPLRKYAPHQDGGVLSLVTVRELTQKKKPHYRTRKGSWLVYGFRKRGRRGSKPDQITKRKKSL